MAGVSAELTHIELDPCAEVSLAVQRIASEDPANLCGAGDAFAGGVLAERAFGLSLLSEPCAFRPHVRAALAGARRRCVGSAFARICPWDPSLSARPSRRRSPIGSVRRDQTCAYPFRLSNRKGE